MIYWNSPVFGEKEKELINEVLESGYVSEGPKTKELEEKLAKIVGTKHVIMTTSCTAALYLAIEADKYIKKYNNGSVIIPSMTFIATKNAVEMANLDIVYEQIEGSRYLLNKNLNSIKNPRIVIPVNLLGRDAGINEFKNSTVICDNAGALGSKVSNGKVGCYSLQANKLINCGQGGFCATNDDRYNNIIRMLKDFGRVDKEDNNTFGFNFKFNDILAAVTLGQLENLENRKNLMKLQYTTYKDNLSQFGRFISYKEGEIPLWIEFVTKKRDELIGYLKAKGISCRKPWKSLSSCKNSQDYEKNVIWFPSGAHLGPSDIEKIINEIKGFYGN